eukprot:1015993-Rhodomonas_salina.3
MHVTYRACRALHGEINGVLERVVLKRAVIKRFFKVSIHGIDEAAERALVLLYPNPVYVCRALVALNAVDSMERRPRAGSDCAAEEVEHDATATHWRIKTLRALMCAGRVERGLRGAVL